VYQVDDIRGWGNFVLRARSSRTKSQCRPRVKDSNLQAVPFAAADLQHALVGVDEKSVDFVQAAVIPASHATPVVALLGDLVPMGDVCLLVEFACFVKRYVYIHSGVILPEMLRKINYVAGFE
jgi:hypothetical protein